MRVRSVGLFFRDREDGGVARGVVEGLLPGATLRLEREPDNEFDGFAIKVLCEDCHIGYIPASQAMHLAPMLEAGELAAEAKFVELEVENRAVYPLIELDLKEE